MMKPTTPPSIEEQQEYEGSEVSSNVDEETGNNNNNNDDDEEEKVILAQTEDKAVGYLRLLVALLLAIVALAVSLSVYFITKQSEQIDFENDFHDTSSKVVEQFGLTLQSRFDVIENFALDMSSRVLSNNEMEWPFVTFPDYGLRAGKTAQIGNFMDITLLPIVQQNKVNEWNEYSMMNGDWVTESLALQEGIPEDQVKGVMPMGPMTTFNGTNFNVVNASEMPLDSYAAPNWQSYPAVRLPSNVDTSKTPLSGKPIHAVYTSNKPVFTRSVDTYDLEDGALQKELVRDMVTAMGETYQSDPFAPMFYPVFNSTTDYDKDDKEEEDKTVVAILRAGIYWRTCK